MGLNETLEYVFYGAALLASSGCILTGTLFSSVILNSLFRKKIKSKEELEKIVDVESKKLGLDPTKITVIFGGGKNSYVCKFGERYNLHIQEGWYDGTVATVRHELYHIYKGDVEHTEDNYSYLRYLLIEEPRALLYELGIKL